MLHYNRQRYFALIPASGMKLSRGILSIPVAFPFFSCLAFIIIFKSWSFHTSWFLVFLKIQDFITNLYKYTFFKFSSKFYLCLHFPSLFYNGYWVSLPGCGVDPPNPSRADIKKCNAMSLFPSWLSWPVLG